MRGSEMLRLPAYDTAEGAEDDAVNVIIETPVGSRIKYKLDARSGLFKVSKVLPLGWRARFVHSVRSVLRTRHHQWMRLSRA